MSCERARFLLIVDNDCMRWCASASGGGGTA